METVARTASKLSLGAKIRQKRKSLDLTLTALGRKCGVSSSFLSQIERDQAAPSVGTLHSIAQALGVPLAEFFDRADSNNGGKLADTPPQKGNLAQIVRCDQRKTLIYPGSGIRNELLSPDLQRSIQMMWVIVPPGSSTGNEPVSLTHEGEECGLVLQGQVEVWVGDEHYILGPGDAIYQKSTIPHHSRNIGDTDAIIVVAITPPTF